MKSNNKFVAFHFVQWMVDGPSGILGVHVRQHVVVELKFVQEIVTIHQPVTVALIVKAITARVPFAPFNLVPVCLPKRQSRPSFKKNSIILVDGGWSDWSPWTACSKSCGKGQKYRRRECNSPKPINGGAICEGSNFEMKNCKIHSCRNADLVKTGSFVCHWKC